VTEKTDQELTLDFLQLAAHQHSVPRPFVPICDLPVLPRLRMLDQTGSSTIRVLPLHIAILTPKLLLVSLLRPVTHQIPIGILLSQPPCVPVNRLLSTLARHFAREATSEIKIFLSNA